MHLMLCLPSMPGPQFCLQPKLPLQLLPHAPRSVPADLLPLLPVCNFLHPPQQVIPRRCQPLPAGDLLHCPHRHICWLWQGGCHLRLLPFCYMCWLVRLDEIRRQQCLLSPASTSWQETAILYQLWQVKLLDACSCQSFVIIIAHQQCSCNALARSFWSTASGCRKHCTQGSRV